MKYRSNLKFDECPVCNTENNRVYYVNKIHNNYYKCDNCDCVYIDNTATIDPYPTQALTADEQTRGFKRDLRSNKLWTYSIGYIDWIKKYLGAFDLNSPLSALSVGCAYAHDLKELHNLGWTVKGVDHDRSFQKRVKMQHGIEVMHGFFENIEIGSRYDLVILASVLPYLADINAIMHKVNSIVKMNRFVFLSIRNMDYIDGRTVLSYSTNIHARQYFPIKSLRLLFKKYGFEVAAIDHFDIKQPLETFVFNRIGTNLGVIKRLNKMILNAHYRYWLHKKYSPLTSTEAIHSKQILVLAEKKAEI